MSTFFRTQMTGRRGNPLVLRKILPNPDLVIASTGADIGFYIVSLVGQVIFKIMSKTPRFVKGMPGRCESGGCQAGDSPMDVTQV